jgi:subtilisin-like proprotein convertase family protein
MLQTLATQYSYFPRDSPVGCHGVFLRNRSDFNSLRGRRNSYSQKMNIIQTITRNSLVRILFAAVLFLGFMTQGRAQTFTFSNSTPITVNDSGTPPTLGSVYPSTISVSGLDGQSISHISVTLYGLTHTFPSDLDILLAGPNGQLSMLMSQVGGNTRFPVSDLTLTLDDSAASSLPINSTLVSGTFMPTRQFPTLSFEFPSPAPAGSSSAPAALSVFNGTNPNGTWSLFVVDDSSPDSGTISGGWSMDVTTVPEPGTMGIAALGLGCFAAIRIRRRLRKGAPREIPM